MTADEPTAIRHPRSREAHRDSGERSSLGVRAVCGWVRWSIERVPLSQIPTADRCRTCWPTTKETR